jgi:hypothetical protein
MNQGAKEMDNEDQLITVLAKPYDDKIKELNLAQKKKNQIQD